MQVGGANFNNAPRSTGFPKLNELLWAGGIFIAQRGKTHSVGRGIKDFREALKYAETRTNKLQKIKYIVSAQAVK